MWHGAAHCDETRGTSSISKVITPVVSASWRALCQAVITHRSGCCGCQGLCCCQPGMLVPSMRGGTPWHAARGSSHSLQNWEEGKRGAARAGKIDGILMTKDSSRWAVACTTEPSTFRLPEPLLLFSQVHVNLLILEARMQAELLYALQAITQYMIS